MRKKTALLSAPFLKLILSIASNRDLGEGDGEFRALPGSAFDRYIRAAKIQHALYQRKPKTIALGRPCFIALIEFIENMLLSFFVHALAVILYANKGRVAAAAHLHTDRAALGGELDGVIQKI